MKIVVLGAGVVGTAAAYWLARDGHEVTVVERHAGAGAGHQLCQCGTCLAGRRDGLGLAGGAEDVHPGALHARSRHPREAAPRSVFLRLDLAFPLPVHDGEDARQHAGEAAGWRFTPATCINRIEEETGIAYDQRKKGILYFFRSQQSFDTGTDNYRFLGEHGLPIEIVDRKRLVELEPGLASAAEKIAGGVYSPIDQTGDSRLFATRLAAYAKKSSA